MIELLPYQSEYLKDTPKNFIMACDVGLGKTFMSLEHYRRHNEGGRLLVVAPASKVRTKDWDESLKQFFDTPPVYDVLSYEMFSKRALEFVDPSITVIFDEIHFICNASAKRSKAAIKVAKVAHQWIGLSGTSLPNGWRSAETYAVLTELVRNKTEFVNRFVVIDRSRGFPLILGYRERTTLEAWWSQIAKPLERTGDMHLPSENIPVEIAMKTSNLREYNKAVKERMYGDEMLDNPSKLFVTLRQIPNAARVDALESIIESTDEHIIIWYNFNSERELIHKLLAKSFKSRKVYEQSGHTSELPKRDKWSTMKPSVTLAQYQSASAAIELTYGTVNVYLSPCTSYANYEQSRGRTLRNGQTKNVLFYHIAVEGSLDRHIWKIIGQKKDFSTDLVAKLLA